MAPVAYVTELGNTIQGVVTADLISPAFVKGAVGLNSIARENLPGRGQGNVKKIVKEGSISVTNPQAESEPLAIASGSEYTESQISLTAAKACVVQGISLEQTRFGTFDEDKAKRLATEAIGRAVSNDIIGMASGFSNAVTATNYVTIADLYTALFTIHNSNCPNQEVLPHFIASPRGVSKIKAEMASTGSTPWVNEMLLDILVNLPATGGYMGSIPGLCEVYQTTGHSTTGGDDQMPFMHPMWALAGMFDSAPEFFVQDRGAEGFYKEVAGAFFYDVAEVNDGAGVNVKGDS